MSRAALVVGIWCLVCAGLAATAVASPWEGRRETGAPAAPPEGRRAPPALEGRGGSSLPVPGIIQPLAARISLAQRQLNAAVSRQMRQLRDTGSPSAFLAVNAIAFLYGVLHAVGPGHGKLVVSSFFVAQEARLLAGVLVGSLVSLLQAVSSIAIVTTLAVMLKVGGLDILERSTWVELVSYGLVVLTGLYMAFSALTGGHGHRHGRESTAPVGAPAMRRSRAGIIVAAGLMPCASAILVLLFALANGVLLIGVGATFVMAAGMAATVSLVGVVTIASRRAVLGVLPRSAAARGWMSTGLSLGGALMVTAIGGLLFLGAWTRLS